MDELRKRRAAIVDNRYDFTFADQRARSMAWQGYDPDKRTLVTKGYQALNGKAQLDRLTRREARKTSVDRALEAASAAVRQRSVHQATVASTSNSTSNADSTNDSAGWAEFQRGYSQQPTLQQPSDISQTAHVPVSAQSSAGLVRTQSMFALADTTDEPKIGSRTIITCGAAFTLDASTDNPKIGAEQ